PFASAKAQIGAALGQGDMADHRCIRAEDGDPVEPYSHAPAAPQIALDIAAEPVGCPFPRIDEDSAVGEPRAVSDNVEYADEPRAGTRLDDVKLGFIGGKAQAVRAVDIAADHCGGSGLAVDAINIRRQLRG